MSGALLRRPDLIYDTGAPFRANCGHSRPKTRGREVLNHRHASRSVPISFGNEEGSILISAGSDNLIHRGTDVGSSLPPITTEWTMTRLQMRLTIRIVAGISFPAHPCHQLRSYSSVQRVGPGGTKAKERCPAHETDQGIRFPYPSVRYSAQIHVASPKGTMPLFD